MWLLNFNINDLFMNFLNGSSFLILLYCDLNKFVLFFNHNSFSYCIFILFSNYWLNLLNFWLSLSCFNLLKNLCDKGSFNLFWFSCCNSFITCNFINCNFWYVCLFYFFSLSWLNINWLNKNNFRFLLFMRFISFYC